MAVTLLSSKSYRGPQFDDSPAQWTTPSMSEIGREDNARQVGEIANLSGDLFVAQGFPYCCGTSEGNDLVAASGQMASNATSQETTSPSHQYSRHLNLDRDSAERNSRGRSEHDRLLDPLPIRCCFRAMCSAVGIDAAI